MRFVLGGALFVVALVFQLRMMQLFRRMIAEVNAALPKESQIPMFGLSIERGRVIRLHRRFFPASSLRRETYTAGALECVAFLGALAFYREVHHVDPWIAAKS